MRFLSALDVRRLVWYSINVQNAGKVSTNPKIGHRIRVCKCKKNLFDHAIFEYLRFKNNPI